MRNPVHCWSPVDSKFNESNPTQFLVKSIFERLYNFADTLIFIANIIERTRCRCWLWVHQQWGRPHPSSERRVLCSVHSATLENGRTITVQSLSAQSPQIAHQVIISIISFIWAHEGPCCTQGSFRRVFTSAESTNQWTLWSLGRNEFSATILTMNPLI